MQSRSVLLKDMFNPDEYVKFAIDVAVVSPLEQRN